MGIRAAGALHTSAVWLRLTAPETQAWLWSRSPVGFEAQRMQHGATQACVYVCCVLNSNFSPQR